MEHRNLEAEDTALLDELRCLEAPDAGAMGRVRKRLAVSLMVAPVFAAPDVRGANHAASPRGRFLPSKPMLGATLVTGIALGAVGHALVTTPVTRIEYRDRVVEAKPAPVLQPPVQPVAPVPSARPLDAAVKPAPRGGTAPGASASSRFDAVDDSLSAELWLLESARSALSHGDALAALRALDTHAKRHDKGLLVQEREALRVRALISARRYVEARSASRRFEANFPKSSLLDAIKTDLSTIP